MFTLQHEQKYFFVLHLKSGKTTRYEKQKQFTIPNIKAYLANENKDWYISFRFNEIKKQIKFGLNKIRDLEKRYFEAQNLAEVLLEKLQKD